ncbi:hypothetical protein J6590_079080 [Homalodisca vitripennis]|nr:hypothetical protein J6590_079080 [Homalodisca vitripennis]
MSIKKAFEYKPRSDIVEEFEDLGPIGRTDRTVTDFYDVEKLNSNGYRAAPKFPERHINPQNFRKMSVKLATQVFSASVSRGIQAACTLGSVKISSASDTSIRVAITAVPITVTASKGTAITTVIANIPKTLALVFDQPSLIILRRKSLLTDVR